MVHRKGTTCERVHEFRCGAEAEAERLAKEHPGQRFYVLEASAYVVIPREDCWHRSLDEPIPF